MLILNVRINNFFGGNASVKVAFVLRSYVSLIWLANACTFVFVVRFTAKKRKLQITDLHTNTETTRTLLNLKRFDQTIYVPFFASHLYSILCMMSSIYQITHESKLYDRWAVDIRNSGRWINKGFSTCRFKWNKQNRIYLFNLFVQSNKRKRYSKNSSNRSKAFVALILIRKVWNRFP